MNDVEKKELYFGPDTSSTDANFSIPDLRLDKRFAEDGAVLFRIDNALAQNASTLIPYPAGKGRYVVGYYNYINGGRSPKAGFTMFDEKGVIDPSFGIGGSTTVQVDSSRFTIPISMFIDASGRLITVARSVKVEGGILYDDTYLICMGETGSLDNTFGNQGLLNVDELLGSHFATSNPKFDKAHCTGAYFDPNGGCYLNANLVSNDLLEQASLIVRLDASGVIDEEFGTRGGVIISPDDELSPRRFSSGLVVYESRIVCEFSSPGDAEWAVLRAFTLMGDPDLSYGRAGKVELEGCIARGCALYPDKSLRVLGYSIASYPLRAAANVWTIDEGGEITKRFKNLFIPKYDSFWRSAAQFGDKIYCGGEVEGFGRMLGCYLVESGELDPSFAELGYGMPSRTSTLFFMPPLLTSRGSLLVVGSWNNSAAVVAVATQ